MKKFFQKHWLYVIAFGIGLVLTPIAIRAAYAARRYFAVGGEYFLIPLALLIAVLIDELKTAIYVYAASTKDEDMSMDPVDSGIKKDAS